MRLELDGSAWRRLIANDHQPQDLDELIELLEINPRTRSAALMFAMERGRKVLEQVASSTAPEATVEIAAADLLVLIRASMARLR
jgi:hypothetical protein